MAHKKPPAGRTPGISKGSAGPERARTKTRDEAPGQGLSEFDREVIEALTDFRDTLRAREPLEDKYTVRKVAVVVPPPQFGPEDVKRARDQLGVSQPVFADFLGTSLSTVRSWEQGQKPPSPMARRLLGLIASDPLYWKSRFRSMVEPRATEQGPLVAAGARPATVGGRSGRLGPQASGLVTSHKGAKKKSVPKVKG